jgi:hypothetical protein
MAIRGVPHWRTATIVCLATVVRLVVGGPVVKLNMIIIIIFRLAFRAAYRGVVVPVVTGLVKEPTVGMVESLSIIEQLPRNGGTFTLFSGNDS